jgi:uncharacterized membrane protein
MESRAKFLGHSIHQMLVVFPLGLLVTSFLFDLIGIVARNGIWNLVAYFMIGAGVIGGLLAGVFGAIDFRAIPQGTRAKALGWWHGAGNVVVIGMFAISWFLRRELPASAPATAIALSGLGVLLGSMTAWIGGELVGRLGIGVDDGAQPNAPSSLKGDARPRRAA